MTDPYYDTIMPKRYNPATWWGDDFQENAGLEAMYQRINALDPKLVIDVGCGRNKHRQRIPNLIGFDASPFPEVDRHCTILEAEFEINSADAVLCLGSVQFISREYIIENMDRVFSWVKPGGLIEMRVLLSDDSALEYIATFDKRSAKYPWNDELRNWITEQYNLSYVIEPWIYNATAPMSVIEQKSNEIEKTLKFRDLKRQCWTWQKN